MKPTEPGFDPVEANEDAEREWYRRCVNKELWKPARAEFHDILMTYELRDRLNKLAIACAVEGAGIFALFYLLFKG